MCFDFLGQKSWLRFGHSHKILVASSDGSVFLDYYWSKCLKSTIIQVPWASRICEGSDMFLFWAWTTINYSQMKNQIFCMCCSIISIFLQEFFVKRFFQADHLLDCFQVLLLWMFCKMPHVQSPQKTREWLCLNIIAKTLTCNWTVNEVSIFQLSSKLI